jgi:hypothetical protein
VRVNETKSLLSTVLSDPDAPGIMLWGPPGIGKSAAVKQIAQEKYWGLVDLRLLLLNPVDLRGVPVPNREKHRADWLPAGFLPDADRDGREGILFLDEINAAPPAVQAAAYQLVLDRRCGEYVLPPGWRVVAAGNRTTDRGVINRMPAPLANRLIHFEVECDLEDWKMWALTAGVHQLVVSFLNFRPNLLYVFPNATEEVRAFPSPRTWEFVSRLLPLFSSIDAAYPAIAGAVGEGAAVEFVAFAQAAQNLPDIEAILNGHDVPAPTAPDLLYALVGALVGRLMAKSTPQRIQNFMQYLFRLPAEFQVLAVKDAWKTTLQKAILACPAYAKWAQANAEVIL